MKLIVGLGNPEKQYTWTRHNLGFLVLEALASINDATYKKSATAQALEVKTSIEGEHCSLMMPLTYMNNSGQAIKTWMDKNSIELQDILVVYDDLALDFGQMRLRPYGTDGGHNGIKSIIDHLKSKDFPRLRLGIGQAPESVDKADFVLSNFTSGQRKLLPAFINEAVACITSWVGKGTDNTMNRFNQKRKDNE